MLSCSQKESVRELKRLSLTTNSLDHVESTEQFVLGHGRHVVQRGAIQASGLLAGEDLEATTGGLESAEHVV